jgi:hypothetical protein
LSHTERVPLSDRLDERRMHIAQSTKCGESGDEGVSCAIHLGL